VPFRAPIYIGCTLLAVVTNYLLGKEMAWDTLNYHLYAGFSAVNDRFNQDYFAAGPQSYFNPYAYVPFYSMVRVGLPALAIGTLLATVHSVIFWLTFELAILVCPSHDTRTRLLFGASAVAMSYMNPILMQQLGSSFADITTGELILGGLLLLAGAVHRPSVVRVVCGGLLLGAATALKPTNAVHAISALTIIIFVPGKPRERIRAGLACTLAVGVGFAIVAAPWAYRMAQMFGNPFFPLLNNLFRSPEFPSGALRHFRFIPESFADALWRPFAMISPTRMIHTEVRAPDPRYAVLAIALAVCCVSWLWHRRVAGTRPAAPARAAAEARTLAAVGCALLSDWILWMAGSGNSRYFLPMSCVAAVVMVALLFRIFTDRPKVLSYILITILATQGIQLCMGAELRWTPAKWGGPWFDIAMQKRLAMQPNLYLTEGAASNSFIAPYLAAGSGLVNFSGGYTLTSGGANGARVEALIRRYAPNLRVLTRGEQLYKDDAWRAPRLSHIDDALQRFGLRVDTEDCTTITVRGLRAEPEITRKTSNAAAPRRKDDTSLISCHVVPDSADHSAQVAAQRLADLALDNLEDACPRLFQPPRVGTEHDRATWRRFYMNTDITAWVSYGLVKFQDPFSNDPIIIVGREDDWTNGPRKLACGRRDGHYFAEAP
jgi:hypothetical protein